MGEKKRKIEDIWGQKEIAFTDLYMQKLYERFGREEVRSIGFQAYEEVYGQTDKHPCSADMYCSPLNHILGCPGPTSQGESE